MNDEEDKGQDAAASPGDPAALDAAKLEGAVGGTVIPTFVEQSCAGDACTEPPHDPTRTEGTNCCN